MLLLRDATLFLVCRYLWYLCLFISKSLNSWDLLFKKISRQHFSEVILNIWRYIWRMIESQKEALISPYYSNPSGKLGGFAQENNTIDSGELDIGRRAIQEVPPGIFWRSQLFIDQPQFLKFNISLQKDALIGVYGRKGLPPSHTQVRTACVKSRTHYWKLRSCIFCIFFLSQDYILFHFAGFYFWYLYCIDLMWWPEHL